MKCQRCEQDKGDDFRPNRKVCRECDNEMAREYRKKLKERKKPSFIICKQCGEEKTNFRINRKKCLDCEREHGRNYRQTTDKAKIWANNNKGRMLELQHNWFQKEKNNINEKTKDRYKNDEKFSFACKHRGGVRHLIKNGKTSKYVNCNGERFRNWLQYQFDDKMSFENHGTYWVADHLIPIDNFLSEKHDKKLILNWINIHPCTKNHNLVKNKHINKQECQKHLENVRHYYKVRELEEDKEYIEVLEKLCVE